MGQEFIDFLDNNNQTLSTIYNNENLKKMFARIDKNLLEYLTPIQVDGHIYLSAKKQLDSESVKLIELKMFPVLSRFGYELAKVKINHKEVLKLIEI